VLPRSRKSVRLVFREDNSPEADLPNRNATTLKVD
jgi:hypothetical protein